ncbi:MAG TPA: hypothetical protein VHE81_01095, partial [Lacipirellulaceae bacterium]|nr:hypothetical protein [Lacipirellulaceae bacterium]
MCFLASIILALAASRLISSVSTPAADLRARYNQQILKLTALYPDWRPKAPLSGALLFIASDEYSPAPPINGNGSEARREYADTLFALAKEAAEAGQPSLAFQWTTETLREFPNHAEARRVLGYVQRDGKWLTPYGARMYDAGKVWDSTRGWVALRKTAESAPSSTLQKGTVAAEVDAARHAEIRHVWAIRTDHFLIRTNHSLAAGAQLAARLEQLYQIWRQLFAGFYYSDEEVRGLFDGNRMARVPARQFKVFYHRDREDYVNALRHRQPMIGDTLGIYFDTIAEAHFFAPGTSSSGDPVDKSATTGLAIATLNHEA